jgi:hypothetical protein
LFKGPLADTIGKKKYTETIKDIQCLTLKLASKIGFSTKRKVQKLLNMPNGNSNEEDIAELTNLLKPIIQSLISQVNEVKMDFPEIVIPKSTG